VLLGFLIVGVVALAGVVILQPVWVELWAAEGRFTLRVRWLGATFSYDAGATKVSCLGWPVWSRSRRLRAQTSGVRRSTRERDFGALWRRRALAREIAAEGWRAFKQLLERFRWERFSVRLSIGTSDPAVTGMLFGYATAARPLLLGWFPQAELDLQPAFESGRTRAEAEARLGLRPLDLILVPIPFLHRLPKRKVFELIREIRQKRKIRGGNSHGTARGA
jgi:hypothetical protein